MRKSQIKGLINDLLNVNDWQHPLVHFSNVADLEIDLIKQEIKYPEEDSVCDFYKKKMWWFCERVTNMGGFADFQSAKLTVSRGVEKVEIVFKNEKYSKEVKYGKVAIPSYYLETQKLQRDIKKLKPSCDVSKK